MEWIADDIQEIIDKNDSLEKDEFGHNVGYGYSEETINRFKEAIDLLRKTYNYVQRIDWLICGDDGEETFNNNFDEKINN